MREMLQIEVKQKWKHNITLQPNGQVYALLFKQRILKNMSY